MRDLRDPQALGKAYLKARAMGFLIEDAVMAPAPQIDTNPSCVEKYGRPDDVKPKWEEIQIR